MNTPIAVQSKIDCILNELPRLGSFQFADTSAERQRIRAILIKILEKRSAPPQLTAFEEKILAKALNVYDAYIDSAIQRKQTGEIIIRPLHTIDSIQPELIDLEEGGEAWIKSVLRSRYPLSMPDELILKLESVRDCDFRIRLEPGYTNPNWPDLYAMAHSDYFQLLPEGYLRRDEFGTPRLYATSRSAIPLPLAMQDVVRLEFANKNHGGELWRHPQYRLNDGCLSCFACEQILVRSKLLAKQAKNQWRYELKIYDAGKLIVHTENCLVRPSKTNKENDEHRMSPQNLLEFVDKFDKRSEPKDLADKAAFGVLQKEWLESERAELLKASIVQAVR